MAAARRKGKWTGGIPVLGYDIDSVLHRLAVNQEEVARVTALFSMYLESQSLQAVAAEANRRGWTTKAWTKRDGAFRQGKPFDKANLRRLLTNVLYTGKVRLDGQTYPGEHQAIVDEGIFNRAGGLLRANGVGGGRRVRNRHGALLKGLLRCHHCDSAMVPSHTRKGNRLYRYYVCSKAQKRGWQSCPCPSLPAQDIEALVVDCLRSIGKDPELVKESLGQVALAVAAKKKELAAETKLLQRAMVKRRTEQKRLLDALAGGRMADSAIGERLAEVQEHASRIGRRLSEIDTELAALEEKQVDERELTDALSLFDPVWDVLYPRERERIIRLLVERVDYDSRQGTLAITFRPAGIKSLAGEASRHE